MATIKKNKNVPFSDWIDSFDGVTNDADHIFGYGGNDTIFAGGGNDLIWGGEDGDAIYGGPGTDTVCYTEATSGVKLSLGLGYGWQGEADGDTFSSIENAIGSSYDDLIYGDGGINSLWGEGGNDKLYGEGGEDSLWGSLGDDRLVGGSGADKLYGGPGVDTAHYDFSSVGVHVSLASGTGSFGDAAGDTLVDIENLVGSHHNDQLLGNGGNNKLVGLDGEDSLWGLGGADELVGAGGIDTVYYGDSSTGVYVSLHLNLGFTGSAAGDTLFAVENVSGSDFGDVLHGDLSVNKLWGLDDDDTFQGYGGGDLLDGGNGIDTASYVDSSAGVSVYLNMGKGDGGDAEGDTLTSIENLLGSQYGDTFWGNDNVNVLEGRAGKDVLKGFGGADTLVGGMGADSMSGGLGPDAFVWEAVAETGLTLATMDTVVDFNAAEGDKLDLQDIDADTTVSGNQDFTFIDTAAFSAPGQIRCFNDGVDTFVVLNRDAILIDDAAIRIAGLHTPDASWFIG